MRNTVLDFWWERIYEVRPGEHMARNARQSRISNCRHVAEYEGNLDDHFERDGMTGLLAKFEYGRKDEKRNVKPRHSIPIDGDLTSGTATLKSAIVLYAKFSKAWPKGRAAPTR